MKTPDPSPARRGDLDDRRTEDLRLLAGAALGERLGGRVERSRIGARRDRAGAVDDLGDVGDLELEHLRTDVDPDRSVGSLDDLADDRGAALQDEPIAAGRHDLVVGERGERGGAGEDRDGRAVNSRCDAVHEGSYYTERSADLSAAETRGIPMLEPARGAAAPVDSPAIALRSIAAIALASSIALPAPAQSPPADGAEERPPLAEYFGFDGIDILPLGGKSGPAIVADFDGDNLLDLIVANNRSSRIELFRQKPGASADDPVPPPTRVNEFPDHWRYERSWIPVGHEIGAMVAGDFDRDGVLELAYAGQPGSIVFLEQTEPGRFELARREPVKGLAGGPEGFAIADLVGDEGLEAIGIVGGRLQVWPILDGYRLGQPTVLSAGTGNLAGFSIDDIDGDGHRDIAGLIPEDGAPLRVWLATVDPQAGTRSFGPQLRFEMPALRQLGTVRLPSDPAARLAVLERASKRLALYELAPDADEEGTGRPSLRYFGFDDPTARKRFIATADVDGDGLRDLVASNVEANSIVVYRQVPGRGFEQAASFPAYADLEGLAARDLDGDGLRGDPAAEREGRRRRRRPLEQRFARLPAGAAAFARPRPGRGRGGRTRRRQHGGDRRAGEPRVRA